MIENIHILEFIHGAGLFPSEEKIHKATLADFRLSSPETMLNAIKSTEVSLRMRLFTEN